jgi:molybdenum cofactor cytidylyltransferase
MSEFMDQIPQHPGMIGEDGTVTMTPRRRVAAIVLAAGGGSRFEGPTHKLVAPLGGRPLVVWAVAAAVEAGLASTLVVTGAVDLTEVLDREGLLDHVTLVPNGRWREGQATSLTVGIAGAGAVDAVVVGLGDQPHVTVEAWRRVAGADADAPIVVATYGGRRGNPVRLTRSVWPDLPDRGDEGARVLMRRRPELVSEVGCPGEPDDVDTLEDLARWS